MMRMSFDFVMPRPGGFASPYAKTYVWEDAAETARYAWENGLIPALYSTDAGSEKRQEAWRAFRELQQSDPLLARKTALIVRYIASHEEPRKLSAAWKQYIELQGPPPAILAKTPAQ
jgi:hypothetical protein